jgi:hypothetical protein
VIRTNPVNTITFLPTEKTSFGVEEAVALAGYGDGLAIGDFDRVSVTLGQGVSEGVCEGVREDVREGVRERVREGVREFVAGGARRHVLTETTPMACEAVTVSSMQLVHTST